MNSAGTEAYSGAEHPIFSITLSRYGCTIKNIGIWRAGKPSPTPKSMRSLRFRSQTVECACRREAIPSNRCKTHKALQHKPNCQVRSIMALRSHPNVQARRRLLLKARALIPLLTRPVKHQNIMSKTPMFLACRWIRQEDVEIHPANRHKTPKETFSLPENIGADGGLGWLGVSLCIPSD